MVDVTESVVYAIQYDEKFPAVDSLPGVVDWFKARLDEIPEEHRARSTCSITADDYRAIIDIRYTRPETKEESADRERRGAAEGRRQKAREIATARRIFDRYGLSYTKPEAEEDEGEDQC